MVFSYILQKRSTENNFNLKQRHAEDRGGVTEDFPEFGILTVCAL